MGIFLDNHEVQYHLLSTLVKTIDIVLLLIGHPLDGRTDSFVPPGFQDLNYVEQSLGGPYLPVAILPERNKDKILLAKMESRLPLEIFEEVLKAAIGACHQVSEDEGRDAQSLFSSVW